MFVYGCVSFFQGPFNLKIDNIFKNQAHVYYEKNIMYISAPDLGNQLGLEVFVHVWQRCH